MKNVFLVIAFILLVACTQEPSSPATPAPDPVPAEPVAQAPQKLTLFSSRAPAYTVDYAMKVSGPQEATGILHVAAQEFAGTRYARIATTTTLTVNERTLQTGVYFIDDKGYTCIKDKKWACTELAPEQIETAHSAPGSQQAVEQSPELYNAQQTADRTIAGEQAHCFETSFEPAPGTTLQTEYCYTADGIPLYIKTTSGEVTSEVTATNVKRIVEEKEFEIPALT
ncbi:hypothetical protein HY490_02240 [Candidatus Woesearchaeota archaeon]|nr:hypothetical protein [Candidatus Woesearchaeota archaeon]